MNPERLLEAMEQFWPFVHAVAKLSDESSGFRNAQLLEIAQLELGDIIQQESQVTVDNMVEAGLLQACVSSGHYTLHPAALGFTRMLHHADLPGPAGG